MTARFLLRGQLGFLRDAGFDVSVVAGDAQGMDELARSEGIATHVVPMVREIDPRADAISLARLVRLFRRHRPALVNASTPKAGLLGSLAGRICGVPKRIYTIRGLRLETLTGFRRALMTGTERLSAAAASHLVAVSPSLRAAFCDATAVATSAVDVLGPGSSNGVDVERFSPLDAELRRARRAELGFDDDHFVVGFVGRLVADKGVAALLASFETLRQRVPRARLLIVGGLEQGDPVSSRVRDQLEHDPLVTHLGERNDPEAFYPLFDVLAFPSLREGFPNAPLEAAASGVPTVGLVATGTKDAVVDGVTGLLASPEVPEALSGGLIEYATNPARRREHGAAARRRAASEFAAPVVWARWSDYYRQLLA